MRSGWRFRSLNTLRQRLARGRQAGRSRTARCSAQSASGRCCCGAQADAEHVIALGEPIVQVHGLAERRNGGRGVPVRVQCERQLVEQPRRPVIEPKVGLVAIGGPGEVALGKVDVAELLERASGRSIEDAGLAQVPQRRGEVAVAAVGLAAFQVAEHRIRASSAMAPLNDSIARSVCPDASAASPAAISRRYCRSRDAVFQPSATANPQRGDENPDEQRPFHRANLPVS